VAQSKSGDIDERNYERERKNSNKNKLILHAEIKKKY
jgi:hypothetical protein